MMPFSVCDVRFILPLFDCQDFFIMNASVFQKPFAFVMTGFKLFFAFPTWTMRPTITVELRHLWHLFSLWSQPVTRPSSRINPVLFLIHHLIHFVTVHCVFASSKSKLITPVNFSVLIFFLPSFIVDGCIDGCLLPNDPLKIIA